MDQLSDPFGTASLRAATVSAWSSSPTRLREDAASETDLVRGGYRDRLLTELAQNAADAAARAGVDGTVRVWATGDELHVANTGAPLDQGGVHALTALRVSEKSSGVGRFGVGFTAVRAVSDEIEIRSAAGGLRFSADDTVEVLRENGIDVPGVGAPVLRLAWPVDTVPAEGFSTEIVLKVRGGDAQALVSAMRSEAVDLLLELDALSTIGVDAEVFERRITELGAGGESVRIGDLEWWQYRTTYARWLIPVIDGSPTPVTTDVLRAPTRSDEELSLPAILVGDVAMQPDRRRILPGADIERLADGYGEVLAALPARVRPSFVPVPGFARSAVDSAVRERMVDQCRSTPWLLAAGGENLVPSRAMVLPGLTEDLSALLVEVFPDLVAPMLSTPAHAAALAAVDVHRIGVARLAEMLTGVVREPSWWGSLYDALSPLVTDGVAAEELAALPVPLVDGRTVTGPRTTVTATGLRVAGGVQWARLVHPDAARPLLIRLGASESTARDLLSDPALEASVDHIDWDDAESVDALVDAVLTLAADTDDLPQWLGSLPLRAADGELRAADELLIPNAPLAQLLSNDSPFGIVHDNLVEQYGVAALRAVGVGWGFGVVTEDLPTGPDHDLDDEDAWWRSLGEDPSVLVAVRDLDLVDARRWPDAMTQLLAEPATRAALGSRESYTAWWLRHHAVIDGVELGGYRAPSDDTFAGLLDPLDHPLADDLASALAAPRFESARSVRLILSRLADPARSPSPAVIARAHRLIAEAVASGHVDLDEIDLPPRVRAVTGELVDPADAIVVDRPWFVGVVPADLAIVSSMDSAATLATVLDVRTASESIEGEVVGVGRVSSWDREAGAVLAYAASGQPLPVGQVVVHRGLVVRCRGAVTGDRSVDRWVTADGTTHCDDGWSGTRGH